VKYSMKGLRKAVRDGGRAASTCVHFACSSAQQEPIQGLPAKMILICYKTSLCKEVSLSRAVVLHML
jgi:hypothetical protein